MKNIENHNENPRDKFKRLASQRTNTIIKKLKILGNCSNKNIYEYNEDDINKIFSEIDKKIREVKTKFHFPKNKEFRL